MRLDDSITDVKGVGIELAKKFRILGIKTISELINYLPRRYDDYSNVQPIKAISPGTVTLKAKIKQTSGHYVRRGMHVTEAVASDSTGSARLVWFNQPYRASSIKPDTEYYISGEFALRRQRLSIQNPSIELVSSFTVNTARIIPIYRETRGLKSHQVRKTIREVLPIVRSIPESLPDWIIREQDLMSNAKALETIHFPADQNMLNRAKKRLGFEEIFVLTLSALLNKYELLDERTVSVTFDEKLAREFVSSLPFTLTDSQKKAVWQIYLDMQKAHPMNRLLEGDVGSGKTVVATMAALMAIRQGFQVAFMAPTEILARQHAETIYKLLTPLNHGDYVSLLIGGMTKAQKARAYAKIKSGEVKFLVGTHALIQEKVDIHNLGLVIVDEQHRFGVDQRKSLQKKAGHMPHVLNMSATPIPRSLALTLYGDLDITTIDTKPIGRKPVITKIESPNSRSKLNKLVESELDRGRQVFVVTALITADGNTSVKSVEEVYKEFQSKTFKNRRVGMLHGKMSASDKDRVMKQFLNHDLDILISTTVIEVGVDVPNASVMVIENADRFGLAQIHQLRGRVGRSEHQGYCFLVMGDSSEPSRRLRALEQTDDGFKLAELDLELRGPGAIYGTLQHGRLDLRVAKLSDVKLISSARNASQEFIDKGEKLSDYHQLSTSVRSVRAITNLN